MKAETDKVFKANPHLHDQRIDFPWCTGYLGRINSQVMFLAENPSLGRLRNAAKDNTKRDPELQWSISIGDRIFRSALVKSGFKEAPWDGRGGWHCYITNIVKMAALASEWEDMSEEKMIEIAKAFAPVLKREIEVMKPMMIVVMGQRTRRLFLCLLCKNLLKLPLQTRIAGVKHYAFFNRGGKTTENVEEYEVDFKRIKAEIDALSLV
jgi:hypothetical protein